MDINTSVYISSEGIDLKKEAAKIKKQIETGVKWVENIKTKMDKPAYKEKVPEDVQQSDIEKITNKELELEQLREVLQKLENMN